MKSINLHESAADQETIFARAAAASGYPTHDQVLNVHLCAAIVDNDRRICGSTGSSREAALNFYIVQRDVGSAPESGFIRDCPAAGARIDDDVAQASLVLPIVGVDGRNANIRR